MTKYSLAMAYALLCVVIGMVGMGWMNIREREKNSVLEKDIVELRASLSECKADFKYAQRRDFAFDDICSALLKTEFIYKAELPENKGNPEFALSDYQINILKDDIEDAKRACWIGN